MAQDKANFDAVLKTVYGPGITELIPTKVRTYEMFKEKDANEWGGRYVEYPVHVGRNQGSGWGTELGALPAAGKQTYATCRIPMPYQYGRITLSAQVMKSSQGPRNSFASAMEIETAGLIKDMSSEIGRAILYDGRGVLGLVNGTVTATTTTITCDSPGGVAGSVNGNRFVQPGSLVAFVDPASGAFRANSVRTVDSVASSGNTFTITAAGTTSIVDNDLIVRCMQATTTATSDTSFQKESMGLQGLVDDGTNVPTLHGINRTTYPLWGSAVISSVGAISSDVLQRGCDIADQRGDGNIDYLIMHHSTRRSYLASMEDQRRYISGDLSSPDSGTVAAKKGMLAFGGIKIMEDKYAPFSTVFGLDSSSCKRWVEVKGEWMDEDGSILQRLGTGTAAQDAFEGVYRIWQNFSLDEPNTCFRLDGVTATVVVVHAD